MQRISFFLLFLMLFMFGHAQKINYDLKTSGIINYPILLKGFKEVPNQSRLRCYWWWLNSMATKESITRDLEEMKKNGYGGASIVDAGSSNYTVAKKTMAGPVFMSDSWMQLYQHAVREADRLGIELSINVQSGWNLGGPMITPELALKKIVYSELSVKGKQHIVAKLKQPETKLMYQDIIIQAIKNNESSKRLKEQAIKNWGLKTFNQDFGMKGTYPLYKLREEYEGSNMNTGISKLDIIDISANYKNDTLVWDVPEGDWTIIRYGWTCTGATTSTTSDHWGGLSLDHLNPNAFAKFSKDVIVPLIDKAKAAGNSLHFLQTDSWEMGNVGWTNNFQEEFTKFRGYDLTPFLPVLTGRVVENVDQSDRFLHDYRQTIGDCIAVNHYELFRDLAHQNGLGIHPESGGPHSAPVDALRVMAISDFPQGEFWATSNTHRVNDDERLSVKQSASVAHTNGKKFIAAEGPTSIGPQWERSPRDLKANIDRVFCSGVNRIVWHTFTSSPKEFGLPGNEYFAGTHMNPNITWWKEASSFIGYLNRCSYFLSQGLFTADVLYYYGDDVPNFVFLKEEVKDLGYGHDWDKCSKESLIKNATVKDGRIVFPDGMNYRLLVLPNEKSIDLDLLKKIALLVKEGLTVIAPRPIKSNSLKNYPDCDAEIVRLANEMWGTIDGKQVMEHRYGKGKLIDGKEVNTVLHEMNIIPDFEYTSTQENTGIDYIHRSANQLEIYFVANRFGRKGINDFNYHDHQSLPDRYEQVECKFRVTGLQPEYFNPLTGEHQRIKMYREENGQTIIPLSFGPEESKFIVFSKLDKTKFVTRVEKDGVSVFPTNQQKGADMPSIEFSAFKNKLIATCFLPGKYSLTFSDGAHQLLEVSQSVMKVPIIGKWTLNFDTAWGGPPQVETDQLTSWTASTDPRIKYYSGHVRYKKTFSLQGMHLLNQQLILDLGNVLEMASVRINGHSLPVKWSAPYKFDISEFVKDADNLLEVEVVNLWPNRLIGDSKLPAEKRFTKTNIMKYNQANADSLLRVSGLLGPVNLLLIPQRTIAH